MKTNVLKKMAILSGIVYVSALNAQTNEVATPLFSADLTDVVSMYADESAENFYLHTESTKYTFSKEGEIISEEPSKAVWACWEDGVMYSYTKGDAFFLTQKGAFCLYMQFPDTDCKDAKSLTCVVTIGE